jgi:hypothetical protein
VQPAVHGREPGRYRFVRLAGAGLLVTGLLLLVLAGSGGVVSRVLFLLTAAVGAAVLVRSSVVSRK